ncbi:MAG: MinD/ParA family ATP-binding protein [Burkholderiales bacterium]
MVEVFDQAEGLRRMLSRDFVRVVGVAVTAPQRQTILESLGAAFAARDKRALVLVTEPDPTITWEPTFVPCDLETVVGSAGDAGKITKRSAQGFERAVAARTGVAAWDSLRCQRLLRCLSSGEARPDVILMDIPPATGRQVSPFAGLAQEVLIVINEHPQSITATYALIKVLAQDFDKRLFRVAVYGVDDNQGEQIIARLGSAARRFLAVRIESAGCLGAWHGQGEDSTQHTDCVKLSETIDAWPYPGRTPAWAGGQRAGVGHAAPDR